MSTLKATYDQRYQEGYREALFGYERARYEALDSFISHFLKSSPTKKVLDYGSGGGLHVPLWKTVFADSELLFCDISSVGLEKLQEKYPQYAGHCYLIENDHTKLPDNCFDVVVSVEVMEHVESLQGYLKEIFRLLKPGGKFVWTTPCANLFSLEHLYSFLTKQIQPTQEGYHRWAWEDPTHLRRLKSREAKLQLEETGFRNIEFRYRAHFFSFACTHWPTQRLLRLRDWLMTLDYRLFRCFPNAASMIGVASK